jgi:hypothetical protein
VSAKSFIHFNRYFETENLIDHTVEKVNVNLILVLVVEKITLFRNISYNNSVASIHKVLLELFLLSLDHKLFDRDN